MKIEVLNSKENLVEFKLDDVNSVTANTFRRLMMGEIPVMAVKEVTFSKNSSALYDEIIAHRIGLIPLKTDLKSYVLTEDCKCSGKGCARCSTKGMLKVNGPKMVLAEDLEMKDIAIKPVYPKMPIVELLKNQKLEIEVTAVLGKGKDHTKFSPGLVFYRAEPKVTISGELKNGNAVRESCPVHVFGKKGKSINVDKNENCIMCNACVDIANPEGAVKVKSSDKNYIMTIESWGQLSPKEMFLEAVKNLDNKLNIFKSELKKAK